MQRRGISHFVLPGKYFASTSRGYFPVRNATSKGLDAPAILFAIKFAAAQAEATSFLVTL